MRIGFDIRPVIFTRAGICTYVNQLILALADKSADELYLYTPARTRPVFKGLSDKVRERVIRLPQIGSVCERIWQEYLLPYAVRKDRISLFHGFRYFLPTGVHCPRVVNIYDLAFKKFPRFVAKSEYIYFDRMVKASVENADLIIALSQSARQDILELYGAKPKQVVVIKPGVDKVYRNDISPELGEQARRKYGIKNKFILFVGSIEPRKNLSTLLDAFYSLDSSLDIQIVIVGGWGWLYDDVLKKVNSLGLGKKVIFTGYVPKDDLAALYNFCEVFVLPSYYEGFGFPVLEAMKCGAAVVTSDTSSLKEWFGQAAYLVDPNSKDSIADGIERLLIDSRLRDLYKAKSRLKAEEFSWAASAQETMKLYKELAG